MNEVDPIRDIKIVEEMARLLKQKSERNYIMFCMGIYSGLRISDILNLRVKHVRNKDEITIREIKTNKPKVFPIPAPLQKALKTYIIDKDINDFLIHNPYDTKIALSRVQAYNILNNAAKQFGLSRIGTHSMRKTFGYHFYQQHGDVVMLMTIFNHDSEAYTLRYIGVNKRITNDAMKSFKAFKI